MNGMARLRFALHVSAAILLAIAAGALLWRSAPPAGEIAPAGLDVHVTTPALPDRGPDETGAIIDASIFSRDRVPPAVRYDPFASDPESEIPVYEFMMPEPDPSPADAVPGLFGTVLGPDGPVALLRLDPALPDAQLYREGDRAGGYRVLKINEQSVVLGGPRGRIVLRLTRSEGSTP